MQKEKQLSGDPDFWLFIALDACIFYAIYVYLSYHRWIDPEIFFTAQSMLSPVAGAVNTIVLLLSSYFVMQGVTHIRGERLEQGRKNFQVAIGLGSLFLIIKISEYVVIIQTPGVDLNTTFYINYFSFTGLHLFHLLIGLLVLWVCNRSAQPLLITIETSALYWHFVDIVWVFLFLQLYLAK